MIRKMHLLSSFLVFLMFFTACSSDEEIDMVLPEGTEAVDYSDEKKDDESDENTAEPVSGAVTCKDVSTYVFNEKDGIVFVEFENAKFTGDWKLKTNGSSYSGDGYMVWEGIQNMGNPGIGATTYKLKINNPGTYQFLWHSAVTTGDDGTEHNDSWLRFNDATDFYGQKRQSDSRVFPKDRGKTPNPEGASKDGWFKIYRSGSDVDFKWQSSTSDNDAHDIFVEFGKPGTYLMEVSARSSGHGIDKFVLFDTSLEPADAIAIETFSAITCD